MKELKYYMLSIIVFLLLSCSVEEPVVSTTSDARIYIDNDPNNSCPLDVSHPEFQLHISYLDSEFNQVLEESFNRNDIKQDGTYWGYVEARKVPSGGDFGISITAIGPCGTCCPDSQTGSIKKRPIYRSVIVNTKGNKSKYIFVLMQSHCINC